MLKSEIKDERQLCLLLVFVLFFSIKTACYDKYFIISNGYFCIFLL